MKILYHHRIRSKDGQYVHIEELTGALERLGHEIIMVGPGAVQEEKFGSDAGVVALLKRYMPKFVYELLELAYALVDYRRLVQAVKRHRPDCLYERCNLYLPSGVWLKRRYALPMLLEVNAPIYEERKKYNGLALDRLARWSEHYAWRGADYVLPVTQVLGGRVAQAGVERTRIVVVPNAINPERFTGAPSREAMKQALGLDGRLVLGFVGFMREWHRLERVIDLLAEDTDERRHLLLVGDGPARSAIELMARRLGVMERVTVTGVMDRDRVANYISAFDIAIQPDVVDYASPLKLFEYMALGRAVVAPDTENIREILTHEHNALLFDPKQPGTFRATIDRLCRDSVLRDRLAFAATDTIVQRGLTWHRNAERVTELFRHLGVCERSDTAVSGAGQ